jgi:chemotaxis protein methyltransferase CheR
VNHSPDQISALEFRKLSDLIHSTLGVAIGPAKRVMVETRLGKRARALGFTSVSEYCRYVNSTEGQKTEWPSLVDSITTHKTDFFREPGHFTFLAERAAPELLRSSSIGVRKPLVAWSSACSTGEEPYTLALVLNEFAQSNLKGGYRYRVYGSDVSRGVLDTARRGVYRESAIGAIPATMRQRYLLRSRDRSSGLVRIAPEIRSQVEFRQINLMDTCYGFPEPLDVVFCRNVMIYFDRVTQQKVLTNMISAMRKGGYLFMGHSESLNGLDLPLNQVAPTVYRRADE